MSPAASARACAADYPALRETAAHVTASTYEGRFEFALNMQVVALRPELDRTGGVPA
jgi:hypothetical protein